MRTKQYAEYSGAKPYFELVRRALATLLMVTTS